MFDVGEKVEFVKYPSLHGIVREILPAEDDLPETVSVDMFIPAGEPGFQFTGITENFWCDPADLRANNASTRQIRGRSLLLVGQRGRRSPFYHSI